MEVQNLKSILSTALNVLSVGANTIVDIVQIATAIGAFVLWRTGRGFRWIHHTPREGKQRRAGYCLWWTFATTKSGSKLTITGLLWKYEGGGSFQIGPHNFNLIPGYDASHGATKHEFTTFLNPPKDQDLWRRPSESTTKPANDSDT